METKQLHKRIDDYLATLKTDSDKLTQFYDASIIAKNALVEVDKLKRALQAIIDNKTTQYVGKVEIKNIAKKALEII